MTQVTRKFTKVQEVVTVEKEVPNGFTIEISEDLAQFFAAMYGRSGDVDDVPKEFVGTANEFRMIGREIDRQITRKYMFKRGQTIKNMFDKETIPYG